MRFAMDSLDDLRRRALDQAEPGAAVVIEPVRDVVDAVLRLHLDVAGMCLSDVDRVGAVVDLVTIHVQGHAFTSGAVWCGSWRGAALLRSLEGQSVPDHPDSRGAFVTAQTVEEPMGPSKS